MAGSQTQEHVSWGGCGNPICGDVHISAEQDPERPDLNSNLDLTSKFAPL